MYTSFGAKRSTRKMDANASAIATKRHRQTENSCCSWYARATRVDFDDDEDERRCPFLFFFFWLLLLFPLLPSSSSSESSSSLLRESFSSSSSESIVNVFDECCLCSRRPRFLPPHTSAKPRTTPAVVIFEEGILVRRSSLSRFVVYDHDDTSDDIFFVRFGLDVSTFRLPERSVDI